MTDFGKEFLTSWFAHARRSRWWGTDVIW